MPRSQSVAFAALVFLTAACDRPAPPVDRPFGYADIGGFGVGSDLTYQLLAGVNWQFARSVSAKAGYRYLYQDYRNNGFVWDMTASGFYFGAGFRF